MILTAVNKPRSVNSKPSSSLAGLLKRFIVVLLLVLLVPNIKAQRIPSLEDMQFNNITSIEGLSNNTVFDIAQDSEGFIWIATREGLNKYDGHSIHSYYREGLNSIPGNFVEQLCATSDGKLLIGTQDGACYYLKESNDFHHIHHEGNSLGTIVRIIELSTKSILIASSNGLYMIDSNYKAQKLNSFMFRDLCEYKRGVIWGVHNDEILLMNEVGEVIRRYTSAIAGRKGFTISAANVTCMFKDSRGTIWLGTRRSGIGFYKEESDEFISLGLQQSINPIEDNFVRAINEDKWGRLWIGTESGLYTYNPDNQNFNFLGQSYDPLDGGLNDKAIYSIFRCRDDILWIGTYFGGLNYTTASSRGFYSIFADGGTHKLSGNAVSEIIETGENTLWIGTEDGGISIFEPASGTFNYLKHAPDDPYSLSANNVHALEEDENGDIWIGTFIGGLNKYNAQNKRIERINLYPLDSSIIQAVFSIHLDSKKRVWAGGIGGLYLKKAGSNDFFLFKPEYFRSNFIYHIEEDSKGNIWICTYEDGIYMLDANLNVTNYRTNQNLDILSNRIVFYFEDSRQVSWFGTVEGGLVKYDPSRKYFKSYTIQDGLANNTVYAVAEDHSGRLWLSTNKGISLFDPLTEEIRHYTGHDGLVGNQFNFKSGLCSSEGKLYFGAVNGLTFFNPDELKENDHPPQVHFTDLKISNTSVDIRDSDVLDKKINFLDEIHLKYSHDVFTLEFVALNYFAPQNVEYAYYLEGLESNWNHVGVKNTATYTNLSPGTYTFHLKAKNRNGIESLEERALQIYIHPPFWLSTWGFLLYGVLSISITFLIFRFYSIRQQEKINVQLAEIEKQKNIELSQHRLNFFTYISHEFKTPLTLIMATLEQIMSLEEIPRKLSEYGVLMRKSAMRLLFLINQLMDFRKIETDHASITLNKGEIIGFLRSTFEAYYPLMEKLAVEGKFSSNMESYIAYFDADKLEKILANLISNSCKSFTEEGKIKLRADIKEQLHTADPSGQRVSTTDLILTIKDNGPGMPPEKAKLIFEPFYSEDRSGIQSSGIGLSLVKSLVKFLNGEIDVSSSVKKGTTFKIRLPLIQNPASEYVKNDLFIEDNSSISVDGSMYQLDSEPVFGTQVYEDGGHKEYAILIVEDNHELISFLAHHFHRIFKVKKAMNGEEALVQIEKSQPDLIISDIMMPKMDGYELCNRIKENFETCHIPIILLTAKTGDESRIEGLTQGADAYLSKPFNLRELDLQVRNIIKAKENLKKRFSSFELFDKPPAQLANKDQAFIEDLVKIVHAHLDDGKFDVDTFCREVNVSRTLLHTKLKKIAGMSTTEFIKSIRLNEAKKMLQAGQLSISEIAYRVGFNDPAYFSRSFKKAFNESPSTFLGSEG